MGEYVRIFRVVIRNGKIVARIVELLLELIR